eukprot:354419-Chlamydomonas_euryale.AAC.4
MTQCSGAGAKLMTYHLTECCVARLRAGGSTTGQAPRPPGRGSRSAPCQCRHLSWATCEGRLRDLLSTALP